MQYKNPVSQINLLEEDVVWCAKKLLTTRFFERDGKQWNGNVQGGWEYSNNGNYDKFVRGLLSDSDHFETLPIIQKFSKGILALPNDFEYFQPSCLAS